MKVIAVVGPTSSGKTALGIYLAKKIGGEIISADSRQVYRGLNLGTGKVTKKEMGGIPHHLLDVVSPKKQFTASDFVKKSAKTITQINAREQVPLIVGGTGFYTDTLLGRMFIPEVPPDNALRERLERKSCEQLLVQLQKLDPVRAKTVEPKHKRRIVRAIEIALFNKSNKLRRAGAATHAPKYAKGADAVAERRVLEGEAQASASEASYDILWLGIKTDPEKLAKKIHQRLLARIKAGMIAEAKILHREGVSYKRMEELGLEYRSLARYLKHEISKEEMIEELDRAIANYAKRQVRWFRRNQDIRWINSKSEALRLAKEFISG